MKLRLRLAVATIAVTVPMVIALVIVDARARQEAAEEELHRFASERLETPGERDFFAHEGVSLMQGYLFDRPGFRALASPEAMPWSMPGRVDVDGLPETRRPAAAKCA